PKARFKMNEGSSQVVYDSVSGYDSSVYGLLGGSYAVDGYDPAWVSSCKEGASCLSFDGSNDNVVLNNLPVNTTAGTFNTVAFWMYWKGKNTVMPFGWNTNYDLFLYNNAFGFNTGQSNIEGFLGTEFLKNSWHFVVAVFPNGISVSANSAFLWIDGVKQTIKHQFGSTPSARTSTNRAFLSGWYSSSYKFDGMLDDFQLFDYRLTDSEANALYQAAKVAFIPTADSQTQVQAQSLNQTLTEQIANISEFVSALSDRIKELLGK
ncbi:MAG: LamG-like jellyroll fold domain-containing protein, partial [bacterium]|nr:LamG-like jellyroll fold domain-containing protein [bacterium]